MLPKPTQSSRVRAASANNALHHSFKNTKVTFACTKCAIASPTCPSYAVFSGFPQGGPFHGLFTVLLGHSRVYLVIHDYFTGISRFHLGTQFCKHNTFKTPTLGKTVFMEFIPFNLLHFRNVTNAEVGVEPIPKTGLCRHICCNDPIQLSKQVLLDTHTHTFQHDMQTDCPIVCQGFLLTDTLHNTRVNRNV